MSRRNIKKAIEEYKTKHRDRPYGSCSFYADDVRQLLDLVEHGSHREREFTLAGYALEAGFVIGHRRGMKDARERDREKVLQIQAGRVGDPELTPAERRLIEMLRKSDPDYAAVIFDLMREPLGPASERKLHVVGGAESDE